MTNTALQLRSLVRASGELELSLVSTPIPAPEPDEVVIRVEASPLNPSDLGTLFGTADMVTAKQSGTHSKPVVTARIPDSHMKSMQNRLDKSLTAGNEGAGIVVCAGSSEAAKALMGKAVATLGGAMYSQYRSVPARQCLILPDGTTPAEGAACFVNPLTVLCMVETMRLEGHSALVNTAAASSLGQMLNRVCLKDKIELVNIVRTEQQEDILRAIGANHVCNTSSPNFKHDLTRALVATGATLAFDAVGGGKLAGQILTCMEAALRMSDNDYSPYGSATHKQVIHLWGARSRTDHTTSQFWSCVQHRRLAADGMSAENRILSATASARAGGRRTEDDLCQPLYQSGFAGRGLASGRDRGLRQASNRGKVFD